MFDCPGYKEALQWEQEKREEAFLGLATPICGMSVVPLTLRRLTYLFQARSAFFYSNERDGGDVGLFLWCVSPAFRPGDPAATDLFRVALQEAGALNDLSKALAEIQEYLDAAFNDAPPTQGSNDPNEKKPSISFTASLVGTFAVEYGWSVETTMETPMSVLYQLLHHISMRKPDGPPFMPRRSGKVKGDWGRAIMAKAQAEHDAKVKAEETAKPT